MKLNIRYFKSFIIYAFLGLAANAGVGFIQEAILGGIMRGLGVEIGTIQRTCGIMEFILGGIVSFLIFRWVVRTLIVPQVILQCGNQESNSETGETDQSERGQ